MFAHLHVHSYYSFLNGTIPAKDLPALAANAGMKAIALTDTNNLTGAIEFYKAAKEAEVKPIIGVELKAGSDRAVLLAKNIEGYQEMCSTVTAFLERFPQVKPKLTLEEFMDNKP